MQLLYRFVEDLVGKGIDVIVFCKLMFFAAMSLVPLALILAILIASLMTFGNLGERLELLAMKSAGIPLYRIMKPIFVAVVGLAVGLFIFQNDWMITSQVKFWQYYFSIRNKSPELAIPEGVFYRDMPGYSIYVQKKDPDTKLLHNVMIYDTQEGFANASVMVADSGRILSTSDNRMLILRLFNGESFKNLKQQSYTNVQELIPYLRESFDMKEIHIKFDTNMDMLDESILSSQFVGKNMVELKHYSDSLSLRVDSVKYLNQRMVQRTSDWHLSTHEEEQSPEQERTDGLRQSETSAPPYAPVQTLRYLPKNPDEGANFYDRLAGLSPEERRDMYQSTIDLLGSKQSDLFFNQSTQSDMQDVLRKNQFEWHRKMTYPVACIIFFFIGAPLGAIMRKGGIGTPIVTAVLFFIIYYVLETTGWKMASDGKWEVWLGMWLPSIVLAPVGLWLSWVATKDSTKLNIDTYINLFKKLLGTDTTRKIEFREITMGEANYEGALHKLERMEEKARQLINVGTLSYPKFFLNDSDYGMRRNLFELVEGVVHDLQDSRDYLLVHKLGKLPFLRDLSRTMRAKKRWHNVALMIIFPVGLVIYALYALRNKSYLREMRGLLMTSGELRLRIHELQQKHNTLVDTKAQ